MGRCFHGHRKSCLKYRYRPALSVDRAVKISLVIQRSVGYVPLMLGKLAWGGVILAVAGSTLALADSISPATGFQDWYTPYGGPGFTYSLGPIGSGVWSMNVGDVTIVPDTGYTDVNPSTSPSVTANAGVGSGIDNPGQGNQYTAYLGGIATAQENFDFEVEYTGSGNPLSSIPLIGYFNFSGTSSCNGTFNAFPVGTGPDAGGTSIVVSAGQCEGAFSTTWMEPEGDQVPAQIKVNSDSNGDKIGETAFASVHLAIDPNVCDALWQQSGAISCTLDSGFDTNAADYKIEYSSNLVSSTPEPATIGLAFAGAILLFLRRRFARII